MLLTRRARRIFRRANRAADRAQSAPVPGHDRTPQTGITRVRDRPVPNYFRAVALLPLLYLGAPVAHSQQRDAHFTEVELTRIALHGPWPSQLLPDAGNEFSGLQWAQDIGRKLFQDPGLSLNGQISCASCHRPALGFTDGRPLATGIGSHMRNTQTLLNVGLQRWFGWDGGTDSLWAATLRPLLSEPEMGNSIAGIAKHLRTSALPGSSMPGSSVPPLPDLRSMSDEELVVTAAKLIASYVRTIRSGRTPFDRYRTALLDGDQPEPEVFSASARRGLKIFIGDANCHVCHYGANFSNGEFHDIGRPFFTGVGKVDPGRYTGIQRLHSDPYNLVGRFNGTGNVHEMRKTHALRSSRADWGRWRTPGLRNLRQTAPYMHDGSLATLRDVVDAYADLDPQRLHSAGESILQPLNLDAQQRRDLVAFLESLSAQ